MNQKKLIIAIDGTSGSGKSTIAKKLAQDLGLNRYNVGMVYRALTKYFVDKNVSPEQIEENLSDISIKVDFESDNQVVFISKMKYDSSNLFSGKISELVPKYAENLNLREIVRINQRQYAQKNNVLMEGRDITSEVLKDVANIKLFINCSYFEKAKRRTAQLREGDEKVDLNKVLLDLYKRDEADATREVSKVQIIKGVKVVDTTNMSVEQTVDYIKEYIGGRNV